MSLRTFEGALFSMNFPDTIVKNVKKSLVSLLAVFASNWAIAQEVQVVAFAEDSVVLERQGDEFVAELWYDVSDGNPNLSGIGFAVLFDSKALRFEELVGLEKGSAQIVLSPEAASEDAENLDEAEETDRCVRFAWADLNVAWPGEGLELPVRLASIRFSSVLGSEVDETTLRIRITDTDPAYGGLSSSLNVVFEGGAE